MKLEKPIQIDKNVEAELEFVKNKMLFVRGDQSFMMVKSFKTEERIDTLVKKRWLGNPITTQVTNTYVTEIELLGYNRLGKFWGVYPESSIEKFFYLYSLMKIQNNYETFIKEPLESFGYSITKVDKSN
jgi:hypothetical protein